MAESRDPDKGLHIGLHLQPWVEMRFAQHEDGRRALYLCCKHCGGIEQVICRGYRKDKYSVWQYRMSHVHDDEQMENRTQTQLEKLVEHLNDIAFDNL